PIKMCTGYELEGKTLDSWPIQHEIIEECKPVYKTFDGWDKRTREEWLEIAEKGYDALPETMKIYIHSIKEELNTEIAYLSIGPDRRETIVLDDKLF
ncbi:hypothetical protein LCGC14_1503230, partial [marine sediment metagenome]